MIQIEEIAPSAQPYYNCSVLGYTNTGDTQYSPLTQISFLIGRTAVQKQVVETHQVGLLMSDGKAMGQLRDKGVKHLSAHGTIEYRSLPLASRLTSVGTNQFQLTTGPWQDFVGGYLDWWDDSVHHYTIPERTFLYSGVLRKQEVSSVDVTVKFGEDRLILYSAIHNGKLTRVDTGAVLLAENWKYRIQWYRKAGTAMYWSYTDFSTPQSAADLATYMANIPMSGGYYSNPKSLYSTSAYQLTQSDIDSIVDAIRTELVTTPFFKEEVDHELLGDLAVECAEQLKFVDQNILSLVFDVEDWRNFRKLWKTVRNTEGWKLALKSYRRVMSGRGKMQDLVNMFRPGSSTYLFGKYAILPSVSDVRRIKEGVDRFSAYTHPRRLHSKRVTSLNIPDSLASRRTTTLTVECAEYPSTFTGGMQKAIGNAKNWGVYPGVINLWDIIPYSFCVDWLVDVGGFLDEIQTYMDMEWYFPVSYCVISEKIERDMLLSSILPSRATGVVTLRYYNRWISRELPLPAVHLPKVSLSGVSQHWAETSALILQRL